MITFDEVQLKTIQGSIDNFNKAIECLPVLSHLPEDNLAQVDSITIYGFVSKLPENYKKSNLMKVFNFLSSIQCAWASGASLLDLNEKAPTNNIINNEINIARIIINFDYDSRYCVSYGCSMTTLQNIIANRNNQNALIHVRNLLKNPDILIEYLEKIEIAKENQNAS